MNKWLPSEEIILRPWKAGSFISEVQYSNDWIDKLGGSKGMNKQLYVSRTHGRNTIQGGEDPDNWN